jgi:hypothetical protein
VDFGEDVPAPDFLRVLISRRTRIGIERGAVTEQEQGGVADRHVCEYSRQMEEAEGRYGL